MLKIGQRIRLIAPDIPRVPVYALFYALFCISYLLPRSRNIWVFDEWQGRRFADNPRYLFLYIHNHQPSITPIWISHELKLITELRSNGLRAYHAYSLRGLWYTARARVIIFESSTSVFYWLTAGIVRVNLWHGLPIKKIVYDSARTKKDNWVYTATGLRRLYHSFFHPEKIALGTYVLAQSIAWRDFFASAFRIKTSHVIVENQPRLAAMNESNIYLLDAEKRLVDELVAHRKTKRIVTYLPTFRDGSKDPLEGSGIDFVALDEFLGVENMHMYIKMHHEKTVGPGTASLKNISFLPVELGIMVMLRYTDILITDYSSVYFEFLVHDKPIVFFPFDWDTYNGQRRDFYFAYDAITPGPKVHTFAELCDELQHSKDSTDAYIAERARIRNFAINPEPNTAPEKVFNAIKRLL